ncbi:uncharacterized protein LOC131443414 isoform X1 [Solea solea]|uniref:uncharacterized protein LOC131443414 isoform X1 n=1 Tax=Solea solea TaxID=90069 RepID=UPI00272A29F9|nr:uncharacterized protein LOC131443414 isoform X1 [Solea solea]
MPLSAFLSRDKSAPHQDLDWALSEVEKTLCRHFTRIVIRGKRGRPVPILVTQKMVNALELLVLERKACGVLEENGYMFARPAAKTHFRGSDCLRAFSGACGATCPKALTSTRLRKHAATLSTVLNMTDTEMDQLANFLGHDIRVHREFYRLPEKTLQLAKVSKLLMALEQGRLAEFHGKNLDEITIGPDDTVLCHDETDETDETREGHYSSQESLAEETLPPTEENDIPPLHKRHKLSSAEDDSVGAVTPVEEARNKVPSTSKRSKPPSGKDDGLRAVTSVKGKSTQKRTWQEEEVKAVERNMKQFITSCIVPTKNDCEKCLRAEPAALKNRDWQTLEYYVYNRITAYKKKVQRNL